MRYVSGILAIGLLGAGCAKGPTGGPTPIQSANRLAVTMILAREINPTYFYSFAFDDDDDTSDGPAAFVGSTIATNGIIGNSFTVLVEYRGGQFSVFRRTRNGASETLERVANPFVQPPAIATGRQISFELNLDATLPNGTRLFAGNNGVLPQRLDINFVTATERLRDDNDLRRKAYDAFGQTTPARYTSLSINTTQSFTNISSGVRETAGDVFLGDTTTNIVAAQLDITDFRIDVQRSRN